MKKTLYCLPPSPFSNFVQSPFPVTSNTHPTDHSAVLFLWLNGWSHHTWCAILLNDIMDVHMLSFRTLMHVLCNKTSSLLSSDTWCNFLLVLWFDLTHTQTNTNTHTHTHTKETQHTQGQVEWHTHKIYIYTNCYALITAIFITLNK